MSTGDIEVPPRSRKKIRQLTDLVRDELDFTKAKFPIMSVLELALPLADEDFVFEVRTKEEMGDNHGLTYPNQSRIILREDVYEGARLGRGRDRFTAAHELGHFLMHRNVALARSTQAMTPPVAYRSSEWQANCFAGELLVSHRHLQGCNSPEELASRFGVSVQAAGVQWDVYEREGLIQR